MHQVSCSGEFLSFSILILIVLKNNLNHPSWPQEERENYEVRFEDGKLIYKHNDQFVDTSTGDMESKWIFVLSTSKVLYVGQVSKWD